MNTFEPRRMILPVYRKQLSGYDEFVPRSRRNSELTSSHRGSTMDLTAQTHKGSIKPLPSLNHRDSTRDITSHTHRGSTRDLSSQKHRGSIRDLPPLNHSGNTTDLPGDNSSINSGYTQHELCQRDYYNSSFPSLMSHLGTKTRNRTKAKNKTRSMPSKQREEGGFHIHDEDHEKYLAKKKMKENMSFTEKMKRFHENRWLRIESVAQEKLEHYDKYVSDMNTKLKQQRMLIDKRLEQQLHHLQREEERKKEDMLYKSPFGRMWRHHRTMQRRAFSLERLHVPVVQTPRSTRTMT